MSSIAIRNLTKSYGSVQVLHGIDLDIADEEFVVLVGPSGCGKSTLLRMIAGLEDITAGDLHIDGTRMNDVSPQKRDLAMVFQSYALYPHMTVAENMAFSLSLRGKQKSAIEREVGDAARILHLEDYLDRLPKSLSGGQRQRVAMGRAIVRHPKAFLFDEPLSNLDAKLRTHMRAEIKQLHQSLGATSVYVTHDQIEAMTLADRIVVMNAGRVEQVGTPLELFDRPRTRFVAGFIGAPAMNFFEGKVELNEQGKPHTHIGPSPVALPEGMESQAGAIVTVGLRPQHIPVSAASTDGNARVELVEQTGCETNLLLKLAGIDFTVQTRDRLEVNAGDAVNLEFDSRNMHVFDSNSGQRLN
ncbi:ABC transporter ATP-binding protein [Hoeflea poritis]|uniref:Sn-glycerol-3-phosphate ABC transporter ATP-binding protein UgpC n=1 Tax=Hoeflea poritis TaxID=2993659 RepID=A0ABT4VV16_9HYPH|nr:sn-glycerol-3-phosphate ABC transporter ATP-binding protein UgpC [Hoeflea poritis]MDA4847823.1 sn-glycerol-3-phosphate ABC transporter ATP-binding protein UgpC [Hoeflea poritis]